MNEKHITSDDNNRALGISGLQAVRLLALINQTRGILRPSAHRDLMKFIENIQTWEEFELLFDWGEKVINADYKERYSIRRNETKQAVQDTQLKIFRKPEKAFQVRWMYRPRNLITTYLARRKEDNNRNKNWRNINDREN